MKTTEPRYAHVVAPAPDGTEYFDPNKATGGLPDALAAHHAARAWGFLMGSNASPDGVDSELLRCALYEFQLARIWWQYGADRCWMARDVITDLASPHVIEPSLKAVLDWYQIDPESIRPYGNSRRRDVVPDAPVTYGAPVKLRQKVAGRCPVCNGESLFLGAGGHVTCSRIECPDPCSADELLHAEEEK